jgi:hypothetical protein
MWTHKNSKQKKSSKENSFCGKLPLLASFLSFSFDFVVKIFETEKKRNMFFVRKRKELNKWLKAPGGK